MTIRHRVKKTGPDSWLYRDITIERLQSPDKSTYPFVFIWPGPPKDYCDLPRLRDAKSMIDSFYQWQDEARDPAHRDGY